MPLVVKYDEPRSRVLTSTGTWYTFTSSNAYIPKPYIDRITATTTTTNTAQLVHETIDTKLQRLKAITDERVVIIPVHIPAAAVRAMRVSYNNKQTEIYSSSETRLYTWEQFADRVCTLHTPASASVKTIMDACDMITLATKRVHESKNTLPVLVHVTAAAAAADAADAEAVDTDALKIFCRRAEAFLASKLLPDTGIVLVGTSRARLMQRLLTDVFVPYKDNEKKKTIAQFLGDLSPSPPPPMPTPSAPRHFGDNATAMRIDKTTFKIELNAGLPFDTPCSVSSSWRHRCARQLLDWYRRAAAAEEQEDDDDDDDAAALGCSKTRIDEFLRRGSVIEMFYPVQYAEEMPPVYVDETVYKAAVALAAAAAVDGGDGGGDGDDGGDDDDKRGEAAEDTAAAAAAGDDADHRDDDCNNDDDDAFDKVFNAAVPVYEYDVRSFSTSLWLWHVRHARDTAAADDDDDDDDDGFECLNETLELLKRLKEDDDAPAPALALAAAAAKSFLCKLFGVSATTTTSAAALFHLSNAFGVRLMCWLRARLGGEVLFVSRDAVFTSCSSLLSSLAEEEKEEEDDDRGAFCLENLVPKRRFTDFMYATPMKYVGLLEDDEDVIVKGFPSTRPVLQTTLMKKLVRLAFAARDAASANDAVRVFFRDELRVDTPKGLYLESGGGGGRRPCRRSARYWYYNRLCDDGDGSFVFSNERDFPCLDREDSGGGGGGGGKAVVVLPVREVGRVLSLSYERYLRCLFDDCLDDALLRRVLAEGGVCREVIENEFRDYCECFMHTAPTSNGVTVPNRSCSFIYSSKYLRRVYGGMG